MAASQLFGLEGKVAVVIGAGSGIGEAVARGCARQGATVCCLDVDTEAATRTAATIADEGGTADAAQLDVTNGSAVDAAFDDVVERHGSLDIVVCTPGINVRKRIVDYTDEEFDRVVGLNLKGNFRVLRAAGRVMMPRGRGSIILFASIRATVVEPGQSVYASTKAGIVQLVRTAAAEFGPSGVRVNAIGPGVVTTPLTRQIQDDPGWHDAYAAKSVFNRWATAEEMVGPTVFLASDAASFVTGTLLMVDGGWTATDGRYTPPGM
ncbi:MAG: SDR family oxidoreductase [Acidobacteria bacterium]|nr:SDR family oxidoreductase [Acidobacteriota bacterium]